MNRFNNIKNIIITITFITITFIANVSGVVEDSEARGEEEVRAVGGPEGKWEVEVRAFGGPEGKGSGMVGREGGEGSGMVGREGGEGSAKDIEKITASKMVKP